MSESYIGGITFFFFALGAVLMIAYLPLLFSKNSGVSGKLLATAAISFISGFYFQYQNGLQFVDYELALFFISCAIAMWVSNFAVYKYGAGIDLFVEDRGLGDFSSFLRKTIKATVFVVPFVLVVNVLMQILFVGFKVDVDGNGHPVRASLIEHLGTFGDFFGGTLTPILTFVSIVLLLMTIRQTQEANKFSGEMLNQAREQLKISADELRLTRDELAGAKEAQQEISETQKIQQFESTFFNLLNIVSSEQEKIIVNVRSRIDDVICGTFYYSTPEKLCEILLKNDSSIARFNVLLYQVIKFVDQYDFLSADVVVDDVSRTKISYLNMVRAVVYNEVLLCLMVSCSKKNNVFVEGGFDEYRRLLECYSIFEHLDFISVLNDMTGTNNVEMLNVKISNNEEKKQGHLKNYKLSMITYEKYLELANICDKEEVKLKRLITIINNRPNLYRCMWEIVDSSYKKEKAFNNSAYYEDFVKAVNSITSS